MLEIERNKNMHGYDAFQIITDDGAFEIVYENNLDLYWRYLYKGSIDEAEDYKIFKITKENFYLYALFLELYMAIREKRPYRTFPKEIMADNNEKLKYYGGYQLYKDGEILWYNDDFADFNNASSFKIVREKDCFKVIFTKSKIEECNGFIFPTYSVRIRNSGSRYDPFNLSFMGMYQKLKEYNPEYHQIHIEEYLYSQKIKKRVKKQ